jgi:hypothetical protein
VSRPDRCKSANDIVIMAWRYAQHLGRTSAERIAVFNFEMTRLERRCADLTHEHAKSRLSVRHPLNTSARRQEPTAHRRRL